MLELWCVSRDHKRRWKLEYNIRERSIESGFDDGPALDLGPELELGDGS